MSIVATVAHLSYCWALVQSDHLLHGHTLPVISPLINRIVHHCLLDFQSIGFYLKTLNLHLSTLASAQLDLYSTLSKHSLIICRHPCCSTANMFLITNFIYEPQIALFRRRHLVSGINFVLLFIGLIQSSSDSFHLSQLIIIFCRISTLLIHVSVTFHPSGVSQIFPTTNSSFTSGSTIGLCLFSWTRARVGSCVVFLLVFFHYCYCFLRHIA